MSFAEKSKDELKLEVMLCTSTRRKRKNWVSGFLDVDLVSKFVRLSEGETGDIELFADTHSGVCRKVCALIKSGFDWDGSFGSDTWRIGDFEVCEVQKAQVTGSEPVAAAKKTKGKKKKKGFITVTPTFSTMKSRVAAVKPKASEEKGEDEKYWVERSPAKKRKGVAMRETEIPESEVEVVEFIESTTTKYTGIFLDCFRDENGLLKLPKPSGKDKFGALLFDNPLKRTCTVEEFNDAIRPERCCLPLLSDTVITEETVFFD